MSGAEAVRAAARPLQGVVRRAWGRAGLEFDDRELAASCVVVAPHPDDETLGCGALIARKTALGARVRVVVATDGRASHAAAGPDVDALVRRRQAEARAACAQLGVAEGDVVFLDLVDGQLDRSRDELAAGLRAVLAEEPADQLVVTATCDGHPDHDAVGAVARRLVEDTAGPAPTLWQYPVWMWTHWPFTAPRRGASRLGRATTEPWRRFTEQRPRTVATGAVADRKRAALACYESQLGTGPDASLPPWFVQPFLEDFEFFFPAGALDHLGAPA